MGYAERVLQPGETIAYRARLHWIIYLGGMLLVVVAIGFAVGAVALKQETIRVGLMLASVIALFLGLFQIVRAWIVAVNTEIIVTSVLVQQSLLGRALDYGAVIIRGVGAGLEPISNIGAPLQLHRHISAPT
jgi:lipopolysaccharide export LptBFGC system permease protein LptF